MSAGSKPSNQNVSMTPAIALVLMERVKRRPWEESWGGRRVKKAFASTIVAPDNPVLAEEIRDFVQVFCRRLPYRVGNALYAAVVAGGSLRAAARKFGADHRRVAEARRELAKKLKEVL